MKYQEEIDNGEERKEEIVKTFTRWKKKHPKKLDEVFHRNHDLAFEKIDCLECANCCKTTSPIFRDVDIKRISKKRKVSEAEFVRDYLKLDLDNDWVLKSSPCPFLLDDNSCGIYDYRPLACSEYPHTDRRKMFQVLDLTIKNLDVCPAVAVISIGAIDELS